MISISSFAWLAAWLSTTCVNIHYPVAGILDPRAGIQNLMPVGEPRYVFWEVPFPLMAARHDIGSAGHWAAQTNGARRLSPLEIQEIAVAGLTIRVSRSAVGTKSTPV